MIKIDVHAIPSRGYNCFICKFYMDDWAIIDDNIPDVFFCSVTCRKEFGDKINKFFNQTIVHKKELNEI